MFFEYICCPKMAFLRLCALVNDCVGRITVVSILDDRIFSPKFGNLSVFDDAPHVKGKCSGRAVFKSFLAGFEDQVTVCFRIHDHNLIYFAQ